MKNAKRFALILACAAASVPQANATKNQPLPLSPKIMRANSAYVDCVCPRALAVARGRALQQLQAWGRFQLADSPHRADLILLFSGNPYLGDYLTRDGPDKRPVFIESTIMTVIDANTGQALWTDSRKWGSWRVDGATKDLVAEFKDLMESQVQKLTIDDLLLCSVTPVYKAFDHLTPEEAINSDRGVARIPNRSDRLAFQSALAPAFCRSAELLVGSANKIIGFQVAASQADSLDINQILQHADQFDFTGGKYSNGDSVYFSAQSKDKKILIQFDVQNHRSVLSSVIYYY